MEVREGKGEGTTWLLLPSSPWFPTRASLWQKLTRSQLAKESEKCNVQGSGLMKKGSQSDLRADNDQYRHLPFSAGEGGSVCDAREMTVLHQDAIKSLVGPLGSQLLHSFLILPIFLLAFNR